MIVSFQYFHCYHPPSLAIYRWKQLFISLDKDGSGTVTKEELKVMFDEMNMPMSLSVLEAWIEDHDVNGDGQLSFEEFLGFIAEQAD